MYASLLDSVSFNSDKPKLELLYQTSFCKEIRIAFREGQMMAAHSSAFPITVEIVKGKINFGLENQQYNLKTGDLLSLEANVLHDLHAEEESLVRLTIHKIITKDS